MQRPFNCLRAKQAGDFYARTLYLLSHTLLPSLRLLRPLLRPLLRLISCRIAPALFFYALLISLPGNGVASQGSTREKP